MFPETTDGRGGAALGEAFAITIADTGVVEVDWLAKTKDRLELTLDMGGLQKVIAPGDVGDLLEIVIDDNGEVVGDADVPAGENGITVEGGIYHDFSKTQIAEVERAVDFRCFS